MDGVFPYPWTILSLSFQKESFLSGLAQVSNHCFLIGLFHLQVDSEKTFSSDSLIRIPFCFYFHNALAIILSLRLSSSLQSRCELVFRVNDF